MDRRAVEADEWIGVRRAAALVGRHPETIRRWVWSGRLGVRRQGNRVSVSRAEVEALARQVGNGLSLREWADRAREVRAPAGKTRSRRSAADLVLEDRRSRSRALEPRARR